MNQEYENMKLNAIALSHKAINVVSAYEHMIIELTESLSTGYCWYYTISDPSILALEEKKVFDFNKPNIIGGTLQVLWRFKSLKCGECRIHFDYYKSWKREPTSLEEYTYIINVL